LTKLAAAKGVVAHVTEPFTEFGKPAGLNVPDNFGRAAFRLTAEQPIHEEPLVGLDSVFIIALNNRIPSQVPPFAEVRAQVTEAFQKSTATDLARAAGDELHKTVTAALAQGKAFQAAVQEKNFKAIDLQPFSEKVPAVEGVRSTDLPALKTTAFALAPGQVSSFVPTRTGGFLVHLQSKVPVAADKVKGALPEYLSELRQSRQREAFNDWLRKESEVAQIVLPGDQQRTTTVKQ
jgi:parvulin-like peptidyl-prolyl isomerase